MKALFAALLWLLAAPALAQGGFVEQQSHALAAALEEERDPARRLAIADSLARLKQLPERPGRRLLVVNIPAFELSLWDGGERIGRWNIIVGKRATPTPEFTATIDAVIVNPWWDIPDSIVRESVGALVRNNPAEAKRRGYVWSGGRYRQRPGPGNALGQVKLSLPNPYRVGMHDTPAKSLFAEPVRTFSHGCIRVEQIATLAATLIEGDDAQARVERLIERGRTVRLPLDDPMPLLVGYFLAESDGRRVRVHDDVYQRRRIRAIPAAWVSGSSPAPRGRISAGCA